MKREIAEFITRCAVCQQIKAEHQKPGGLLQPLPIPQWKWDDIAMDFIVGLPSSSGHNAIWVFVDRLTKVCRLLTVSMSWSVDRLAKLYVERIVPLHEILVTIVSDRDPRFTSGFWRSLQRVVGTELKYSSAYHPQTDW